MMYRCKSYWKFKLQTVRKINLNFAKSKNKENII